MKINHKILSIPPYISTSWKSVLSLHLQKEDKPLLQIVLLNGATIEIPELEQSIIDAIFAAHEKFLELDQSNNAKSNFSAPTSTTNVNNNSSQLIGFPLKFAVEGSDNFGTLLQHNPEAANSPDLPKEVLEKIATLSKVIGFEAPESISKPEPHCNCMHCQIMRAIHGDTSQENNSSLQSGEEEVVSDEELKFRDWDIEQTAEKLYQVKNPLNQEERYNVFLGNPIGCTCGQKGCEHIRAVLSS